MPPLRGEVARRSRDGRVGVPRAATPQALRASSPYIGELRHPSPTVTAPTQRTCTQCLPFEGRWLGAAETEGWGSVRGQSLSLLRQTAPPAQGELMSRTTSSTYYL